MRQVGVPAFLLLVVAGVVSGIGYAMSLPRPVVLIGLVCLAVGALGTLGAAFANARENGETFARSIGRSATTIHTRSTCATTKGLSRKVRQGPAVRPRAGARESALGYQRITGELNGLGIIVSATTVQKILRHARLGPAGER